MLYNEIWMIYLLLIYLFDTAPIPFPNGIQFKLEQARSHIVNSLRMHALKLTVYISLIAKIFSHIFNDFYFKIY